MPDRWYGHDGDGRLGRLVLVVDREDPAPVVTVTAQGEIDLATASALRQRLETLLDDAAVQDLVLDLRAVPFCDVTGLKVLVRTESRLRSRGGQLTVVRPCKTLRIVAGVLGLSDHLHLAPYDGADAADRDMSEDDDGAATA
jgi:anti-anti-sigma factor